MQHSIASHMVMLISFCVSLRATCTHPACSPSIGVLERLYPLFLVCLEGQGSQDMQNFTMWIGNKDILKKGLTVILLFTVFAISTLPIMISCFHNVHTSVVCA